TTGTVTISLDSSSKGIVWITGLPEGRMKAYLSKSPSTYRIISQKTDLGKQVPEGTLIFTPETNTLNIALGVPYNTADPASVFPAADLNATANGNSSSTMNNTANGNSMNMADSSST